MGLADALLAATAEQEDADLKTLNVKHYPMIKGLFAAYKRKGRPPTATNRAASLALLALDPDGCLEQ